MAYKIKSRKRIEKNAYFNLINGYYDLDSEARKQGWDSYGEASLKDKEKIAKTLAKKYPYIYGT